MIKINSNFTISKDSHGWTLKEKKLTTLNKGKYAGEKRQVVKETYHPNTEKVALAIIDRIGDMDGSLEELISVYKEAIQLLQEHVKFICNEEDKQDVKTKSRVQKTTTNDDLETDSNVDKEIKEKNTNLAASLVKKKQRRIQKIKK